MSKLSNKLVIAGAGTGKTHFIIEKALETEEKTLITTYTEQNALEIRKSIIRKLGYIPKNLVVQTWFSFLLQHGVRPYQSCVFKALHNVSIGLFFTNGISSLYVSRSNPKYYFHENISSNKNIRLYSDKISDFVVVCNSNSENQIIKRLSKVYRNIFVDEVQDLVGYDLEIIKLLFESEINITLVGDPRQVVYSTHSPRKYPRYQNGKIKDFLQNEIKSCNYVIDEQSLLFSHRCHDLICQFSNLLYPDYFNINGRNYKGVEYTGIYLVRKKHVDKYLKRFDSIQLIFDKRTPINKNFKFMTFGNSKGLTFDRVLIYPTQPILKWLEESSFQFNDLSRSKLYVAITRAKYSVTFVIPDEIPEKIAMKIKNIYNIL